MIRKILEAVDKRRDDWCNSLKPILAILKNMGWKVISKENDPNGVGSHQPVIYKLEGPYEGMTIDLHASSTEDFNPWVFQAFIHLDPGATNSALELMTDKSEFVWWNQKDGVIKIQSVSPAAIIGTIETLDKLYGLRFKGQP